MVRQGACNGSSNHRTALSARSTLPRLSDRAAFSFGRRRDSATSATVSRRSIANSWPSLLMVARSSVQLPHASTNITAGEPPPFRSRLRTVGGIVDGPGRLQKGRSMTKPDSRQIELIDRYWRAANYVSVGQIYLMDNPLLTEPLKAEHVKPRLLGHWGTTPGLNFVYAHLNRAIVERDLDAIYVCGPGHGGPAMVANTYLEGTYSELYPSVSPD